jgi:hypothetical protein
MSRTLIASRWRNHRNPPADPRILLAIGAPICPRCGSAFRDSIAIKAGYCSACQDFTRMCAAGRRIVSPDVMFRTSWHSPCTTIGEVPWEVTIGGEQVCVLLCARHDAGIAAGEAPWLLDAARLRGASRQHLGLV